MPHWVVLAERGGVVSMGVVGDGLGTQHANLVLEGAVRHRGEVLGVKPVISRHRHVVVAIGLVAVREVLGWVGSAGGSSRGGDGSHCIQVLTYFGKGRESVFNARIQI